MTDEELKFAATELVHQFLEVIVRRGQEPECAWIVFALAADTMERALLYTAGVMPSTTDYVRAKALLDRLLEEGREIGLQTGKMTDAVIGFKRGAPQ